MDTLSILRDFHKITGAHISLHDLEFNEIMCYPPKLSTFCNAVQLDSTVKSKCILADRKAFKTVQETQKTLVYRCHCGLIETVAPIYNYGILSGYFMMGQIADDKDKSIENIKALTKNIIPKEQSYELYESIPILSENLLDSYINILKVLSEYIKMVPKSTNLAESTKLYINKNFNKKISINNISEVFECSRTTLINNFKKYYGINIGDYINNYRLTKSADLLIESNQKINKISSDCGFSDQNYFSKAFYKKYNCTPSEYRRNYKKVN